MGRPAQPASPAVIYLQDTHRPQKDRAATIRQLVLVSPDYKAYIGDTDEPTAEHPCQLLLTTAAALGLK